MAATIRNFAWVINGDGSLTVANERRGKKRGAITIELPPLPRGKPDGREGARKFKLERRNPRHLGDWEQKRITRPAEHSSRGIGCRFIIDASERAEFPSIFNE